MNRINLIREIFKKTDFQNYLEIGCSTGGSFLPVNAKYKTAVDPFFNVPLRRKVKWLLKEPGNFNNRYFEEESDIFFLNRKTYLEKTGQFDVVLVDGLHTFQASLNDVMNSLRYLNNCGIIIMHDCYPPHRAAALPTKNYPDHREQEGVEGWNKEWCGDVWKTIVYLRRYHQEILDICVIDTDYGLGIIRPVANSDIKHLYIDEKAYAGIDTLTYDDLIRDTGSMLNLKDSGYALTVINEIAAANANNKH